jgi:hypothetical protein
VISRYLEMTNLVFFLLLFLHFCHSAFSLSFRRRKNHVILNLCDFSLPRNDKPRILFIVIPSFLSFRFLFVIPLSLCHSDEGGITLFVTKRSFKNSNFSLNERIKSNFFSLLHPLISFSLAMACCTQVNFS